MQKPRTVLVVDDDSMMREAANGESAIAQCTKLKPDLVLLDINIPKMDGLQALEEIRKTNLVCRIMMVSADATMDRVAEAIEKGASGFVVKPLNAASVLDRIDKCFKKGT